MSGSRRQVHGTFAATQESLSLTDSPYRLHSSATGESGVGPTACHRSTWASFRGFSHVAGACCNARDLAPRWTHSRFI